MSSRSQLQTAFKLGGLSLRADASRRLETLLGPLEPQEAKRWTEKLLEALQKKELDSPVIGKDLIDQTVRVSGASS